MKEEIDRIINDLEGCVGMFDYLLTPEDNNLLVSHIRELQQENQQLKESYCNRTDCSGRLHDSRKYPSVKQQLDLYKSVLDEIRKIIQTEKRLMGYAIYDSCLLLIEEQLDKVKE